VQTESIEQPPQTMSICGVMCQVKPENMPDIEPQMLAIPGLEIHGVDDDGKVIITIESDSYKLTGERISTLQKLKGVLSASMIYQHTEEL